MVWQLQITLIASNDTGNMRKQYTQIKLILNEKEEEEEEMVEIKAEILEQFFQPFN